MTVGADQINRIVRSNLIELPARREYRRLPVRIDPPPTGHPRGGFGLPHALLHAREEVVDRLRALEIQRYLALTNTQQVTVRIGQPRHNRLAAKIDHARRATGELLRIVI